MPSRRNIRDPVVKEQNNANSLKSPKISTKRFYFHHARAEALILELLIMLWRSWQPVPQWRAKVKMVGVWLYECESSHIKLGKYAQLSSHRTSKRKENSRHVWTSGTILSARLSSLQWGHHSFCCKVKKSARCQFTRKNSRSQALNPFTESETCSMAERDTW